MEHFQETILVLQREGKILRSRLLVIQSETKHLLHTDALNTEQMIMLSSLWAKEEETKILIEHFQGIITYMQACLDQRSKA